MAVAGEQLGGLAEAEAAVRSAMWWPDYVPYEPLRSGERRRVSET